MRTELLENASRLVEAVVQGITGREVLTMHTDISTSTGERLIVFVLDGKPDIRVETDGA